MKVGFVNIFGKPNSGKSTLVNALVGEKMAIVSPKVQTTRHRIKAFLNKPGEYQVVFSDTPGIIEARYKLHERMMKAVKGALEDADVAILLFAANDDLAECDSIFGSLKLNVPCIVVINKIDIAANGKLAEAETFFAGKPYCKKTIKVSALQKTHLNKLLAAILEEMPEGEPFYNTEDLSDMPTRFFVGEMIREKLYSLYGDEIPYHTAILVNEFKERESLVKIQADVIVTRDSQKGIVIGEKGKMIKQLGTEARAEIEAFIGSKVFLELNVKVRPKWRDNDNHLREYGYGPA